MKTLKITAAALFIGLFITAKTYVPILALTPNCTASAPTESTPSPAEAE